jgi:hypothetical protein
MCRDDVSLEKICESCLVQIFSKLLRIFIYFQKIRIDYLHSNGSRETLFSFNVKTLARVFIFPYFHTRRKRTRLRERGEKKITIFFPGFPNLLHLIPIPHFPRIRGPTDKRAPTYVIS